ncbi:uncharacterized protein BJ171DRAFT_567167 [Polychytrium aggregatum]|uniref:uncharacterized protein n=1 Tax=Polychytrium aggregatum TaxID=110093 RepID=UPI0022FEAE40|nr:uncharacterized protein BJ171DRAFT_567167 [Polychytrium aggregatum]KAI9205862.1 hypothetical protein BJ171DRAFT_567167 [Polychytrium aggregatum]
MSQPQSAPATKTQDSRADSSNQWRSVPSSRHKSSHADSQGSAPASLPPFKTVVRGRAQRGRPGKKDYSRPHDSAQHPSTHAADAAPKPGAIGSFGKSQSASFASVLRHNVATRPAHSAPRQDRSEAVPITEPKADPQSALLSTSIKSDHSDSDGNDSDGAASEAGEVAPAAPPTFWNPIVFHCPMPNCPPNTLPVTDPNVALEHLKQDHQIVFKDYHHVMPYLEKYVNYWASRLNETSLDQVAALTLETNQSGDPIYSFGEESNQEDKELRDRLQREKLNEMLAIQERERHHDSALPRKCLFCKLVCDNRSALFKHMFNEHGFNIGLPDNLVEVNEFLDTLQTKLSGLQCLYCEKIFKTSAVLRKHMRKKKHFKINPRNHSYDRFYIINYLEPGKNWESFENDKYDSDEERRENDEWEDWDEPVEMEATMCFFDETMFPTPEECSEHLKSHHDFDLKRISLDRSLDFYGLIRLINYIRRATSLSKCFSCDLELSSMAELVEHFQSSGHASEQAIPASDGVFWSDPQFLFPTYENDPLLSYVGGEVMDEDDDECVPGGKEVGGVLAEDDIRQLALKKHLISPDDAQDDAMDESAAGEDAPEDDADVEVAL